MSKLFDYRDWVTTNEAAAYLTSQLSQNVKESDIFRLGLDHLLSISLYFVGGVMAKVGTLPNNEFIVDEFDQLALEWQQPAPQAIDGVWDLISLGAGEIELEKQFLRLVGGPTSGAWGAAGIYLARPDRSEWAELVSLDKSDLKISLDDGIVTQVTKTYRTAHELPESALFVVRMNALDQLVDSAAGLEPGDTAHGKNDDRLLPVSKSVMLARHSDRWAAINSDMKHAHRNGLAIARVGTRGWDEAKAIAWAESNGKLYSSGSGSEGVRSFV